MFSKKTYCDLPLQNGAKFYLKAKALEGLKKELDEFLEWDKHMESIHFAKRMMFSHELKANDQLEGYVDDIEAIEAIIAKKTARFKNRDKKQRVLNLYHGYQYILTHSKMDSKHLKELYAILSDELLDEYSKYNMGDMYREARVFIFKNGRPSIDMDEGVKWQNIESLMNSYFRFVHANINPSSPTDEYIKSQIMHLYFVYVHPYFDVNGRTSRTMSLWYLLKQSAYPYIIFNRGISFKGTAYDQAVREATRKHDMTPFLLMMLDTLKVELEKEHIMQEIDENTPYDLGSLEFQTLLYFLTMSVTKTSGEFARFYNRFNDRKPLAEIQSEMLEPLIDMDILKVESIAQDSINSANPNLVLSLNESKFENNPNFLKRVKIK